MPKGDRWCEPCGREFKSLAGLATHRLHRHADGSEDAPTSVRVAVENLVADCSDHPLAQGALVLASVLDDPATHPRDKAGTLRELRLTLVELDESKPKEEPATGSGQVFDLEERRRGREARRQG